MPLLLAEPLWYLRLSWCHVTSPAEAKAGQEYVDTQPAYIYGGPLDSLLDTDHSYHLAVAGAASHINFIRSTVLNSASYTPSSTSARRIQGLELLDTFKPRTFISSLPAFNNLNGTCFTCPSERNSVLTCRSTAAKLTFFSAVFALLPGYLDTDQPSAMASAKYPSTIEEFNRRFPSHAVNTIHNMENEFRASGSSWRNHHLEACRVIVRPCAVPPILDAHIPTARKTLEACSSEVTDLMRLSASQISKMSHQELRQDGGVFETFYVALADVSRLPEVVSASNDRPHRDRRPVHRPDYNPGQGFSSSPAGVTTNPTLSSPYTPQSIGVVDYEDQLDRTKHEVLSVDLAAQFISSTLDRLAGKTSRDPRIEFSRAPNTFELQSPFISCRCEDDGSIVQRGKNKFTHQWTGTGTHFLCSLEGKSRYIQANILGQGIVSDQVTAQQVCEMLGSVMSSVESGLYEDIDDKDRSCILISIHQTDIAFLHADFSPEYMAYIYSQCPPLELPHLMVHRSRDYNLAVREDRKLAAEIVVAIATFYIEQEKQNTD
ncbi:hypothetical protein V500_07480 [Pseudogymnoascus sp. VKM F-4518 (FW-2643)]|nr:hypothetical protein V500_07480 [Pseudogymnoascus sp. VKM F-4518 (FW-2643)]